MLLRRLASLLITIAVPYPASASPGEPIRSTDWGTISTIALTAGVASSILSPRVYYSPLGSTVGLKTRFHVSVVAPALSLAAAALLVNGPIREGLASQRPGCESGSESSNCASYGSPSTHAFASLSATSASTAIYLFDMFIHSDGRASPAVLTTAVLIPVAATTFTLVGRAAEPGRSSAYESAEQLLLGAGSGLVTGALIGTIYASMQQPRCPYGSGLICW